MAEALRTLIFAVCDRSRKLRQFWKEHLGQDRIEDRRRTTRAISVVLPNHRHSITISQTNPADPTLLPAPPQTPSRPPAPPLAPDDHGCLGFVQIMNNLRHAYPQKQLADISTSYGFISLLHLANEKGLVIENCQDWTDLRVRRDDSAIVSEGDI